MSAATMNKTWRRRLACSTVRSVKSRSADAMQMPAPTMGLLPMLSDGTKTCSAKPFPWHLRSHTINTRKC